MFLQPLPDDRALYVLESPYLDSGESFTCGVEKVSALFKQAIVDAHPAGNFFLAGYSVGAVYAYETARQLIAEGHSVQGLLLFDMAVPLLRPNPDVLPAIKLLFSPPMLKSSISANPAVQRSQEAHMAHMVRSVAEYDPLPMPSDRRPSRVWLLWCSRSVIERLGDDDCKYLGQSGFVMEQVPGFLESPAIGPLAWITAPGKPPGPNGWDRLVGGQVKCDSIDADHFSMLVTPDVAKFQKAIQDGLVYCSGV
ncbi:Alpha/Beta hydrolase protein [Colletotrichum navitas]|nr:Alpha/Beta hydrolase protein [Colletotrichum navitas]KAK1561624.1 Alpha/Beta hydrolase protein [Colletotrichum navitas]